MMGHTVSTYHDIQSKGIEFLRNLYASAGLSIKRRLSVSKIDTLKEMMRAWGLEPEKILTKEALAEPHRAYANSEEREKEDIRLLGAAMRESLKKELITSPSPKATMETPKTWNPRTFIKKACGASTAPSSLMYWRTGLYPGHSTPNTVNTIAYVIGPMIPQMASIRSILSGRVSFMDRSFSSSASEYMPCLYVHEGYNDLGAMKSRPRRISPDVCRTYNCRLGRWSRIQGWQREELIIQSALRQRDGK